MCILYIISSPKACGSETWTQQICIQYTPPKTNMEPKNVGFEDDFPFQRGDFQVPC